MLPPRAVPTLRPGAASTRMPALRRPPGGAAGAPPGLDDLRARLRSNAGHKAVVVDPLDAEGRAAPPRLADEDLAAAVAAGGDSATSALQVAMLEVLTDLRKNKKSGSQGETLDDLLFGVEAAGAGEDGGLSIRGANGSSQMLKLNRAIEADPERWNQWLDQTTEEQMGSDVSGLPWSMAEYGRQKIRFGKHADLEKFFAILAHLHAVHRRGPKYHALLGAKIGQALKAVQRCNADNGSWDIAWLGTGIPDPRPSRVMAPGLQHPAEMAAQAAYLREMHTLAATRQKLTGGGGRGGGAGNWEDETGAGAGGAAAKTGAKRRPGRGGGAAGRGGQAAGGGAAADG